MFFSLKVLVVVTRILQVSYDGPELTMNTTFSFNVILLPHLANSVITTIYHHNWFHLTIVCGM